MTVGRSMSGCLLFTARSPPYSYRSPPGNSKDLDSSFAFNVVLVKRESLIIFVFFFSSSYSLNGVTDLVFGDADGDGAEMFSKIVNTLRYDFSALTSWPPSRWTIFLFLLLPLSSFIYILDSYLLTVTSFTCHGRRSRKYGREMLTNIIEVQKYFFYD